MEGASRCVACEFCDLVVSWYGVKRLKGDTAVVSVRLCQVCVLRCFVHVLTINMVFPWPFVSY